MALPLPKVVADVGPGGPLVTAMRGGNALSQDMLDTQIKGVQAKYAPLTTQAEAASKLAYANLMGPQFMAKLMGNQDILANIPDQQKAAILQRLQQAGMGGGTGANVFSQMGMGGQSQQPNQDGGFSNYLQNLFHSIIGQSGQPQAQPQSVNAMSYGQQAPMAQSPLTPQDRNAINQMQPGDSYVVGSGQAPQGQAQQPQQPPMVQPAASQTWAENVGQYGGIKKEGEEAGKIRANDIKDLSDTVFSGQTKQATLDNINNIISSPAFEQVRQTPILGQHELAYFQRYGTPEQQNMVGQLVTLSGNVIRDASQDFKGAFRKGEQTLIQNMKINSGDTFNAARGKMEQLTYLNQMITQRARLTGQLMQQGHISKLQAEDMADKQINGDAIRSQIHNTINPKPTDDDIQFMADKYKVSPDEIRKRLKAKGFL